MYRCVGQQIRPKATLINKASKGTSLLNVSVMRKWSKAEVSINARVLDADQGFCDFYHVAYRLSARLAARSFCLAPHIYPALDSKVVPNNNRRIKLTDFRSDIAEAEFEYYLTLLHTFVSNFSLHRAKEHSS